MSNYTPIITYGTKDSLSHGDPNKVIRGSQLDAELSAIATAISSKLETTGSSGSFTVTYVGGTTAPTYTATWVKSGSVVFMLLPGSLAASNSGLYSYSGLPSNLQPPTAQGVSLQSALDNSAVTSSTIGATFGPSSSIIFTRGGSSTSWTAAGNKGLQGPQMAVYMLV